MNSSNQKSWLDFVNDMKSDYSKDLESWDRIFHDEFVIRQYDAKGFKINDFDSFEDAAKSSGATRTEIRFACIKKHKLVNGCTWLLVKREES